MTQLHCQKFFKIYFRRNSQNNLLQFWIFQIFVGVCSKIIAEVYPCFARATEGISSRGFPSVPYGITPPPSLLLLPHGVVCGVSGIPITILGILLNRFRNVSFLIFVILPKSFCQDFYRNCAPNVSLMFFGNSAGVFTDTSFLREFFSGLLCWISLLVFHRITPRRCSEMSEFFFGCLHKLVQGHRKFLAFFFFLGVTSKLGKIFSSL